MRKRIIIAFSIALILTLSITTLWSAQTTARDGDDGANIIAASGAPTGASETPKKGGNRLFRIFKAPFKAVGKLFERDKEGKITRMTEKDAEKFESVGAMRIENSRQTSAPVLSGGTAHDHLERGRDLLERGQLNEAIAELSLATSLNPRMSQAHSLLAVAFDRKGLRERAKESYARAIDAAPEDAQTLNNLGYSLYSNGHYRAAVERLKRAAKLAPDDERILNNLALAQCRLGKYNDAFKNFARAGGEFNGRLNVATLLERAGRETDAIEHYEAARRLHPTSATVLRRLADLYHRTGQPEKAEAARQSLTNAATEVAIARSGN